MRDPSAMDRMHAVPCQHPECLQRALNGRRRDSWRRDGLCDMHGALADQRAGEEQ